MKERKTTETMQTYHSLDDRERFFNELKDLSKRFVNEVKTQGTLTLTLSRDEDGDNFVFIQDYVNAEVDVDYRAKYQAYYVYKDEEDN